MPGTIGDETVITPFDGYPYLITRIGRTALRNVALLPADWRRERLLDLARRQADANRLETCLCLGPADAVYITPGGGAYPDHFIPTGTPEIERLALAEPIPSTEEVLARRAALEAYRERMRPRGYTVGDGLEGGRPATAEDVTRLSPRDASGIPAGLARCAVCH